MLFVKFSKGLNVFLMFIYVTEVNKESHQDRNYWDYVGELGTGGRSRCPLLWPESMWHQPLLRAQLCVLGAVVVFVGPQEEGRDENFDCMFQKAGLFFMISIILKENDILELY